MFPSQITMDSDIFGSNLIEGIPNTINIPDPFLATILGSSDEMFPRRKRKAKKSSWKRNIIWTKETSDINSDTSATSKISFEPENTSSKKRMRMKGKKRSSRSQQPKRRRCRRFLRFRVLMPLLCTK